MSFSFPTENTTLSAKVVAKFAAVVLSIMVLSALLFLGQHFLFSSVPPHVVELNGK